MLTDQGSAYVGRFARGWPRLPGSCSPGNHRPVREPAAEYIGATCSEGQPRHRSSRREQGYRSRAPLDERLRARGRRGPRGQHVVDEQDPPRSVPLGTERAPHDLAAVDATPARLRSEVVLPLEERHHRDTEPTPDDPGEREGLVEPSGRPAPAGQRHPGHGVGRGTLVHRGHGGAERRCHAPPSGELQPMHGIPGRPVEQERRAGQDDRSRRAVAAGLGVTRPRGSASPTPGGSEGHQPSDARIAERPRALTAARAPRREERVQDRAQHARTLPRPADIPSGEGNGHRRLGPAAVALQLDAQGARRLGDRVREHPAAPGGLVDLGLEDLELRVVGR
jgi:hypothetical protein